MDHSAFSVVFVIAFVQELYVGLYSLGVSMYNFIPILSVNMVMVLYHKS